MKKRILVALLCASLATTLFAGCGDTTDSKESSESSSETTSAEETSAEETSAEESSSEAEAYTMADPEEITQDAVYHFTFDEAEEGVSTVARTDDIGTNDGATYGIAELDTYKDDAGNEVPIEVQYVAGPVGNCAYLDGNYGLKFDVDSLETETYTISFWINADRLATFGPTLQLGSNIGMNADNGAKVSWMNFTQAEWGTNSAKIFPVVWDRNSETGAWPWVYAADDAIHGKGEWVCVTLVATGNIYSYVEDGFDRNGCKLYLDGVLAFDASADAYGGLATGIMDASDNFECYFGINFWDTIFKGYIDDMYMYNYALTDGQVATLYQLGDASATATVQ